jgi:hypothetical protein
MVNTLQQTTSEDLGHLKDLEISKYKREMKARMPIKLCWLIFVNCGLFSFQNIENLLQIKFAKKFVELK